jgi:hypothetical protein
MPRIPNLKSILKRRSDENAAGLAAAGNATTQPMGLATRLGVYTGLGILETLAFFAMLISVRFLNLFSIFFCFLPE